MRYLSPLLIFVALACFAFSYWGLNTISGRNAFDEMAGMIPLASLPIGLILLGAAAVKSFKRRNS